MVGEVNKIIYNTLVAERAINLPGVGTLLVTRRAASVQSRDVIASPSWSVEFSSHAEATSLVDVIAFEGHVDVEQAEDIYSRWLDKASSDSAINIEGVGVLRNNSFVADKSFLALFNGSTKATVCVKRNSGYRVLLWLLVLVACAVLGAVAALYKDDIISIFTKHKVSDAICQEDRCIDKEVALVEVFEVPAEEIVAEDDLIEEEEVDEGSFEGDIEESLSMEEVVAEPDAVVVEPSVIEELVDDSWTSRDDIRHYVVAGSYSTMVNAERAIASLTKKYEYMDCKIFELGKMYAVAVYGSSSHDDCSRFIREHRKDVKEAWIFTPKEFR